MIKSADFDLFKRHQSYQVYVTGARHESALFWAFSDYKNLRRMRQLRLIAFAQFKNDKLKVLALQQQNCILTFYHHHFFFEA